MSNLQKIQSMTADELADFLSKIAYARYTPWSKQFSDKFCKTCKRITGTLEDGSQIELTECDFSDGVCPHGGDLVWWLNQNEL